MNQMKHDENLNELDYENQVTLDYDSDLFGCLCNAFELLFICIGVVPGPYDRYKWSYGTPK